MSTQKKYTLMADGTVKDNEKNIYGIRPGVWRWEQYQEWLAEGNTPTPVQPSEFHVLNEEGEWVEDTEKIKEVNRAKAEENQRIALNRLMEDEARKKFELPGILADESIEEHKQFMQSVQTDIDDPPTDPVYNPPLPPGVIPPALPNLVVVVKREPGWNSVLGWRATISSMLEDFEPTNLAISVHTGENCEGYKYTTGAFQQDSETGEWYSVCPAGQEPGDSDEFMGLLYGGANLACFTLPAGTEEITVNAL